MAAIPKRATIRTPEGDEIKIRYTSPPTEDDIDDIVKTWKANKLGESRDISATLKAGYETAAYKDVAAANNVERGELTESMSSRDKLLSALSPRRFEMERKAEITGKKPSQLQKLSGAAVDAGTIYGGAANAAIAAMQGKSAINAMQTRHLPSQKETMEGRFVEEALNDPALIPTTLIPGGKVAKPAYNIGKQSLMSLSKAAPEGVGAAMRGIGNLIKPVPGGATSKIANTALTSLGEGATAAGAHQIENIGEGRKVSVKDAATEMALNMLVGTGISTIKEAGKGLVEAVRPSDIARKVVAQNFQISKNDFKVDKFDEFVETIKKNNLFDDASDNYEKAGQLINDKYGALKKALKDVNVGKISEMTPEQVKKAKGIVDISSAIDGASSELTPSNLAMVTGEEGQKGLANKIVKGYNDKTMGMVDELQKKGYNIGIVDERKYNMGRYAHGVKDPTSGSVRIYADPEAAQKFMQDFKKDEISEIAQKTEAGNAKEKFAKKLYYDIRSKIDEAAPNAKIKEINKELQYLILARDLAEKKVLLDERKALLSLNDLISISGTVLSPSILSKIASAGVGVAQKLQKTPALGRFATALESTEKYYDAMVGTRPFVQDALRGTIRVSDPVTGNKDEDKNKSILKKLNYTGKR